jgi:arylsulfatase A-like enzyme
MSVDVTATCVDAAGARADHSLDGVSLYDVVADPGRFDDRMLLYDRDDRDDGRQFQAPPADGLFTKTRKFVRYTSDPPVYELYDLEQDPDERRNVAEDTAYAVDRRDLETALDDLLSTL